MSIAGNYSSFDASLAAAAAREQSLVWDLDMLLTHLLLLRYPALITGARYQGFCLNLPLMSL